MNKRIYIPLSFLILASIACSLFFSKEESTETPVGETTSGPPPAGSNQLIPTSQAQEINPNEEMAPIILWSANARSFKSAGDKVFVQDPSEKTMAYDIGSGDILWTSDVAGKILAADENKVFIQVGEQRVEALDTTNGKLIWRILLESPLSDTFGEDAFVYGNYLFLRYWAGEYFTFYLVDSQTGDVLESLTSEFFIEPFNDIFVIDGRMGYRPATKEKVWEYSDFQRGRIPENCGDVVINVREDSKSIDAIDPINGNVLWSADVGGINARCRADTPFVSADSTNEKFGYFHDGFTRLGVFNKLSGETRWFEYDVGAVASCLRGGYCWLASINDKVIISHPGFGITQAYSSANLEAIWENINLVLSGVIGFIDNSLIGYRLEGVTPIYVSLNALDGAINWENANIPIRINSSQLAMLGRWLIFHTETDGIFFVDKNSGNSAFQVDQFGVLHTMITDNFVLVWNANHQELIAVKP